MKYGDFGCFQILAIKISELNSKNKSKNRKFLGKSLAKPRQSGFYSVF
jgi:hypothetical protein